MTKHNVDRKVVEDFGREWSTFNQEDVPPEDLRAAFEQYFYIFPFHKIGLDSVGFDMGCGSGRWAKVMAPKVKALICVEPSQEALSAAKNNLRGNTNVTFECASVSESKIPNDSQDFGYCLGVLHHIPDTAAGVKSCAEKLKSGAPFLLYLYYRFDGKPLWFRLIWRVSDIFRRIICRLPYPMKLLLTNLIAISVYWPLSRAARVFEKCGCDVSNLPLSAYRTKSLYSMRTDALDRFGTRLERRFTKPEIERMLEEAGFVDIVFSNRMPGWVALAYKA